MNRIFAFCILLSFTGFSGSLSASDPSVEESRRKTVLLDRDTFLARVFDYTKQDTWKYLGEKPCVIDFYADWCPPCVLIAPILESLAREYEDRIIVYKINVDEQKELADMMGVHEYPSVLFVPLSGRPRMSLGAMKKREYRTIIEELLLGNP